MVGTVVNAKLHSDPLSTMTTTLSEHGGQTAVATDMRVLTSPGSLYTEERESVEFADIVVKEPGELNLHRA